MREGVYVVCVLEEGRLDLQAAEEGGECPCVSVVRVWWRLCEERMSHDFLCGGGMMCTH